MQKLIAVVGSVAVLSLAATRAAAEEADTGRPTALPAGEGAGLADHSAEGGGPARQSADPGDLAVPTPTPEGLTEAEWETLEKVAAENPELADQAGGYVSNEDLLIIVVVVLLVVILI